MRSFVVLLLLVIVFLVGALFGSERDFFQKTTDSYETHERSDVLYTSDRSDDIQYEPVDDTYLNVDAESTIHQTQPIHATHKVARFFEVVIKGFYEIIVSILYQISLLFF